MTKEEKNLSIMSKANNYNRWIYNNIKEYIGNKILEVGCGIGTMTSFFADKQFITGIDINENSLNLIRKKFSKSRNCIFMNYDISKGYKSLKKYGFDTVICINVLEHIKDDKKTIKNIYNLLKKDGNFVLMVPAFTFLYGTIDKADNHYRRYNKKQVVALLNDAGFKIQRLRYMNLPGFFGWYYHNKIIKVSVHRESDLSLFNRMTPIFEFIEKLIPIPFGLSLIAIGKK